jgi:hypothetical protein
MERTDKTSEELANEIDVYGTSDIRFIGKMGQIWDCYSTLKLAKNFMKTNLDDIYVLRTIGAETHDYDTPIKGCTFMVIGRDKDYNKIIL